MVEYHDKEWGVPVHDDRLLFEFLILEGAQAGLSWETILKKRENYRRAFDHFNPDKIAAYGSKKVRELLANEGIVRNRLKIAATISNAQAYLQVKKEFGTFDRYLWQFDFVWNTRKLNDGERTIAAIKSAEGKRLMYKAPDDEKGNEEVF